MGLRGIVDVLMSSLQSYEYMCRPGFDLPVKRVRKRNGDDKDNQVSYLDIILLTQ